MANSEYNTLTSMEIKIKKLHPEAVVPSYAYAMDAGMDLFASEEIIVPVGGTAIVSTGIAMEIPEGYAGLIWDKSGLAVNHGLKTFGGVIDAGYRGEVKVGIRNFNSREYVIKAGNKVAQMLIQKIESPRIVVVDELSDTSRGDGGFGSSGK
ncbi:MAG: Deoxyuridine 5'-triphosphate nucleotidohydrolase [Candidatus Azambacteria bacterium GW2011_GWA1_44_9]|uniref:dUTP diphosphatase n=2 Tax=Parcubacteria group TaxID=1794811 RepID=A0A0G1KCZ3_9BACT|nr:MAG: Deoxyuridine 5'-triphosphate nucleotidohydrolase [Candidatus Azambacteria bacterium GW2011_GWA1_44_9]